MTFRVKLSASSFSPIFFSSACANTPISATNGRVSKPITENISVCDVCPSEPFSGSHAPSSNIVSASNICPRKIVSASVSPGKPVCANYVCQSRSVEVRFVKVNQLVAVIS